MPVNTPDGQLTVTTSLGMAYIGTEVVSVDDALNRADEQLYKAKESGRDAVFVENIGKLNPADYEEPERAIVE
jgi:PleD family two-component response regulator